MTAPEPSFPVSRTASDESRQNMLAQVVARALANLAEAGAWAYEVEARFSSPWFCLFCRAKPGAQRSISADLIYSLLFVFIGAHYLASLGLGYFVSRQSNSLSGN